MKTSSYLNFPPFLQLHLSSSTGPALRDISLNVNASIPLTIHPSHFTVPEVSSTHKVEPLVVTVVCTPSLLPTSTSLTVSATYNSPNGNCLVLFQWSVHIANMSCLLLGLPIAISTHQNLLVCHTKNCSSY